MDDEDLIPISALQHYLYCPRQCALIHIERLWAESQHTAEGRLLHEHADKSSTKRCKGVRVATAIALFHPELGLSGVADMVEFHESEGGERAVPVEYKRGRPKAHRADEVQLCAQALCLEVMVGHSVFELEVDTARWTLYQTSVVRSDRSEVDSLRFYYLGVKWQSRVEHVGAKAVLDLNGPLIL
jgi:CRISPR-associated protein Cas4